MDSVIHVRQRVLLKSVISVSRYHKWADIHWELISVAYNEREHLNAEFVLSLCMKRMRTTTWGALNMRQSCRRYG